MTKGEIKRQNLMAALVAEFSEGAIISRQQLLDIYQKKSNTKNSTSEFPHPIVITTDPQYKVSRGKLIVTSSTEPELVKAAVLNALKTVEDNNAKTSGQNKSVKRGRKKKASA